MIQILILNIVIISKINEIYKFTENKIKTIYLFEKYNYKKKVARPGKGEVATTLILLDYKQTIRQNVLLIIIIKVNAEKNNFLH